VGDAPGNAPFVLHHTSKGWSTASLPTVQTKDELFGVSGITTTSVWAVGDYTHNGDHPLTYHWDGKAWSHAVSPGAGDGSRLTAVSTVAGTGAWATGYYITSPGYYQAFYFHRVSSKWVIVKAPAPPGIGSQLWSLRMVSPSLGWAVGAWQDGSGDDRLLVEKWDGSSWKIADQSSTYGALFSVVTPTPGTVEAVGEYQHEQPVVASFDGSAWSDGYVDPSGGYFNAATLDSSGDVLAVGLDGAYQTLIEDGSGLSLARVASPSPGVSNFLEGATSNGSAAWVVGEQVVGGQGKTLVEYTC